VYDDLLQPSENAKDVMINSFSPYIFEQTVRPLEIVTVVSSPPRRFSVGLANLWEYRYLIYIFVWRDLKARYKQTILGALWAVLQPLLTTAVLSFVFRRLAQMPSDGVPYPVFILFALLPWQFFAQGVVRASNSLVSDRYLLTRVFVPRLVLPVSAILSGLPDLVVALCASFGIMLIYGAVPKLLALMVIPFVFLDAAAALCLGLFLAPLNARYRDVSYLVPFLLQLGFFMTPISYPSSLVPPMFRHVFLLNPMASVVDGFRWAATGSGRIDAGAIATSVIIVSLTLVAGLAYFQKMDRTFADVI
jgi:lipopolysaccharide transport system permease protein